MSGLRRASLALAKADQLPHVRSQKMKTRCAVCLIALTWVGGHNLPAAAVIQADICIYGGTCAAVAAAVQTARMGRTAVVAEFGQHLGGLSSGGLGATDIGN